MSISFCQRCGNKVKLLTPSGDDRQRHVCGTCGHIHYRNPLLVVCALPCHEDKVLLCKRAIEPRYGLWTLPGGFMENGESTQQAALRETLEEACARISLHELYTVYSLPHISQVHMFFRADLLDMSFGAGNESLETRLFSEADLPWDAIAFSAVRDTLRHYFEDRRQGRYPLHCATINDDNEQIVIETPH